MKQRLDVLLVERGLMESRERAQRAIMAGLVSVGGHRVDKAGCRIALDSLVELQAVERYVGRGGFKMEGALQGFGILPEGWTCLDVGASTGGFTDCLLQHGAAKVYALDVGHSQLDWKIRSDARVVALEKVNCRYLSAREVPELVDLLVADVSFISLTLILGPALERVRVGGMAVVLIKPQFELRREEVGRGGVVKEAALHARAVERVQNWVAGHAGVVWKGVIESPIRGGDGNVEYLAWIGKP
ncbi:MAG: 23S rRNA (cytidine1920-2'-O)/16S rRNA (cytidine1409-2'-O)-methyltransferase [Verrucomicrobia bacterium]|nr:MAG: 23S rRNA (cytidine1920-2'-O)/16S rRNA (cytidine1409-2'-O)-methyltransferase [Verrucomicrobiota bacterium]